MGLCKNVLRALWNRVEPFKENAMLQKLGLEIRKVGSTSNLYRDVDLILQNHHVPSGGVSSNVQVASVAHSLQRMLNTKSSFDVCCIRDCAEICQIVIPADRLAVYRSIHCMNWSEMLPDFRQMITAMVLDDFRQILNPTEVFI